MRKVIPAVVLGIIIFVSGCTMPFSSGDEAPVGRGYPGVSFVSFYPVSSEVQAGGKATLYMSVQNNGYFKAEDVSVTIFNCGSINEGFLVSKGPDDGEYICNQEIDFGDLEPPNRAMNIPGEIVEEQITFDVPTTGFPEGRSPGTFSGRVSYNYKSTASRDMVITTFNNWREKGGNLEVGALTYISDPSPLSLDIVTPTKPVIITEGADLPTFTVAIDIRNMGGGYVKDKTLQSIKLCYDENFVTPVCKFTNSEMTLEQEDVEDSYWVREANDDGEILCEEETFFCVKNTFSNGEETVDGFESEDECKQIEYGSFDVNDGSDDVSDESDYCLSIDPDPDGESSDKLILIGTTHQRRTVSATFEVNEDVIAVQDIVGFSAEIEYPYHTDTTTQIVVLKT